ncbi:MAG: hypothetical protein H6659_11290 [Ardenticatenaceae bacterium]|nr:hypothetical protein [Ardenticatenaceae bacterium]MCB8987175.1 hypothetical protein [Ardenticatenaceae bacterium]
MTTAKRIIAIVLMLVSVLGLLLALFGIVGSWSVRNKATDVTIRLLTAGETAVAASQSSLDRVDQRLTTAGENITFIENEMNNLGTTINETNLVFSVVSRTVGTELAPVVIQAQETAANVRDTVTAVNAAIEAINAIPFISLDEVLPQPGILQEIGDELAAIRAEVEETRTAMQTRKEEIVNGSISIITDRTTRLNGRVDNVQGRIAELDARLATASSNLAQLKISLPRLFTLGALALSIAFLFAGLAFASLFFHSWSFFADPERSFKSFIPVKKDLA